MDLHFTVGETNDPLSIDTEELPEGIGVHVSGEVDLGNADRLKSAIQPAVDNSRNVILDVSHLTYIDSSGLYAEEFFVSPQKDLSNAYEHAYALQPGPLEIDLLYDEAKIELTIHDDGEPITDSPIIPTTPPSGERGRGLYLVGQLMDESKVIHPWNDPQGIGVRVVKYLQRS